MSGPYVKRNSPPVRREIGLSIVYYSDIFMDGNPQNDDCNLDNNQLVVSGAQLARWARDGREVVEVTRDGSVTFRDRES